MSASYDLAFIEEMAEIAYNEYEKWVEHIEQETYNAAYPNF